MTDVAAVAGVSAATVSRTIHNSPNVSDATRAKVRRAVEELGFVPSSSAASLARGRADVIGVVVPTLQHWYHRTALDSIDTRLRGEGFSVVAISLHHSSSTRFAFKIGGTAQRADAFVFIAPDLGREELRQVHRLKVPYVRIGANIGFRPVVAIDEVTAAKIAVEHLIHLGHRHIAHLAYPDDPLTDAATYAGRLRGWSEALSESGITAAESWQVRSGPTALSALESALKLLNSRPRPTAVFAGSDEMAFVVLQAAARLWLRVPHDLSIVGVDDHEWSAVTGLTTVRQDPAVQGIFAAEALLAELVHGTPANEHHQLVRTELVMRATTAAPRNPGHS